MSKRQSFVSFLKFYRPYLFLWICLLFPGFFTFGKVHFVWPIIYVWTLVFPQKLPWIILLAGGIFQDILQDLTWGTHGAFYSIFLLMVLSQRASLYNRSFALRWTAFGIILSLTQGFMWAFLCLQKKVTGANGLFLYDVLIPWLSFPLFSQTVQKYLGDLLKSYVP